jgi:hypothetical protein
MNKSLNATAGQIEIRTPFRVLKLFPPASAQTAPDVERLTSDLVHRGWSDFATVLVARTTSGSLEILQEKTGTCSSSVRPGVGSSALGVA